MQNQNLIDRYVQEVGRNLPRRMRADVELELRSLLADSLEERAIAADDHEAIIDLLTEFGHPAKFAASYLPERSLIGPTLYPIFLNVMKIALLIIGGIYLIGITVTVLRGSAPAGFGLFVAWIFRRVFDFGGNAVSVFGVVAFAFAALEWFGIGQTDEAQIWNPQELPEVADHDQLKKFEMIFEVIGTIIILVGINFFSDWIGLIDLAGEEWGVKLLWAEGFFQHVPWLSALWVGEIALKSYVLQQGRWERITRWVEATLQVMSIVVLNRIVQGPDIFEPAILSAGVRMVLMVVIVIVAIDTLVKLWRLMTRPKPVVVPNSQGFSGKAKPAG